MSELSMRKDKNKRYISSYRNPTPPVITCFGNENNYFTVMQRYKCSLRNIIERCKARSVSVTEGVVRSLICDIIWPLMILKVLCRNIYLKSNLSSS